MPEEKVEKKDTVPAANAEVSGKDVVQPPASDVRGGTATVEQKLSEMETELQRYRDMLAEKEKGLQKVLKERETTLQAYRELLLRANPLIPADMVSGNSVAELNSALERANAMVEGVRSALEKDRNALRVPAGVSLRAEPDVSSFSSKEKIRLGLERMRR